MAKEAVGRRAQIQRLLQCAEPGEEGGVAADVRCIVLAIRAPRCVAIEKAKRRPRRARNAHAAAISSPIERTQPPGEGEDCDVGEENDGAHGRKGSRAAAVRGCEILLRTRGPAGLILRRPRVRLRSPSNAPSSSGVSACMAAVEGCIGSRPGVKPSGLEALQQSRVGADDVHRHVPRSAGAAHAGQRLVVADHDGQQLRAARGPTGSRPATGRCRPAIRGRRAPAASHDAGCASACATCSGV